MNYTMDQLLQSGASGFESAARYLNLPYDKLSELHSAMEGFLDCSSDAAMRISGGR
ncbi:MAG: hypothetical protein FWH15_05345 [Betaproteobacteria bacterium]|nr:hypothetical protein [Betaproteobacteria bacterium]